MMQPYKSRGVLKLKKPALGAVQDKKHVGSFRKKKTKEAILSEFKLKEGRVVSNETTVQGFETRFIEDVKVGDTLGVNHPTSMDFEERTVVSVLSQRSLTVDMPFSTNLISTCPFFVRDDGSYILKELEQIKTEHSKPIGQMLEEKLRHDLMRKQATVLRLRERKGMWGYQTTMHQLDEELTAEELLDMRIKRTGRDKYC